MPRPNPPPVDHEYERLNPGAHADPPQPKAKLKEDRSKSEANLPGSQNADLRGAKRDRTFRGSTT
ncbi:MAG TPA: hypothetical protein VGJ56_04850 [Reyranella sp.]|jgi:hypothetical protein